MRKLFLGLGLAVLIGSTGWLFGSNIGLNPLAAESAAAIAEPGASEPLAVIAEGRVVPRTEVQLAFERSGTLAEVLVTEGQQVEPGQALVRLDRRDLALRVERARINLARAEARYDQVVAGVASETLAIADASLAQADTQRSQVVRAVSAQDLAAAQAQRDEARAALELLLAGPKATEITQAEAALTQARANLEQQQTTLSAAKTYAALARDQAANGLRNLQDSYSRIVWANRELLERNPDLALPQERIDQEAAAWRAVENAELALQQAQVAAEQAQHNERTGLTQAEARVHDAEARLSQLRASPDRDRLAAAQARLAQAEANLARLQGDARTSQLDVATAGLAVAQAQRDQVAAGPREVDLALARVEIQAAQVELEQAQFELARATLYAPLAGRVVELKLRVGEVSAPGVPIISLADLGAWQIETTDLSELDVVRLQPGDAAMLSFDALPALNLAGQISQIKPMGPNRQGEIVYTVVITPNQFESRLHWNMTALVTIPGE
ncbi:MAG: HlyD family secretion protein [Oscillochloridaceae bacterium umkhey_bin13]